jgi:hypothetical protein
MARFKPVRGKKTVASAPARSQAIGCVMILLMLFVLVFVVIFMAIKQG